MARRSKKTRNKKRREVQKTPPIDRDLDTISKYWGYYYERDEDTGQETKHLILLFRVVGLTKEEWRRECRDYKDMLRDEHRKTYPYRPDGKPNESYEPREEYASASFTQYS